ncbi:hypothetical protein SAMN05444161_8887 [Rhizobiales bacterium GAS191]|nr:hypothetical protein SAMN05444161_8887 [Rhizobiales bacterium GAS191]
MDSANGYSLGPSDAARAEIMRRQEDWLLPPRPRSFPSPAEIEQRVQAAPHVVLEKEHIRALVAKVYADPILSGQRILDAAADAESASLLSARLEERPVIFGPLRGEISDLLRRPTRERQEAMENVPELALRAGDLSLVEASARRDVKRHAEEAAVKASHGVQRPSDMLIGALEAGEKGHSVIASSKAMSEELQALDRALAMRLEAPDYVAFREDRLREFAERHQVLETTAVMVQRLELQIASAMQPVARQRQSLEQQAEVSVAAARS